MILRPRLSGLFLTVTVVFVAAYFGFHSLHALGLRHGIWEAIASWACAAWYANVALQDAQQRAQFTLAVDGERFSFAGMTWQRVQVTAVRRFQEPPFNGVRVEIGQEAWIPINAQIHRPRQVLAAFRAHGYHVE